MIEILTQTDLHTVCISTCVLFLSPSSPAQNLPQIIVFSFSSFYVPEKCGMYSLKNRYAI